jgi:hypothetical protein
LISRRRIAAAVAKQEFPLSIPMVLAPLFVQILVTFVIGFSLGGMRAAALTRREVSPRDIDLGQPNWPRRATQCANCFKNQFELPVLFYVLTVLAIITRHADFLFVVMAWVFVLSRVVHGFIHTGSNNLNMRGLWFGVGALVLFVMWVIFMVRIMLGLP